MDFHSLLTHIPPGFGVVEACIKMNPRAVRSWKLHTTSNCYDWWSEAVEASLYTFALEAKHDLARADFGESIAYEEQVDLTEGRLREITVDVVKVTNFIFLVSVFDEVYGPRQDENPGLAAKAAVKEDSDDPGLE